MKSGGGFIKDENYIECLNSAFLFAYKDKLFLINNDLCVLEIDDYVSIGSGAPEAIRSLLSTEGEEARTRIIKAIKASAANDIYVDYPIVLSDTETTKFEIIAEDTLVTANTKKSKTSEWRIDANVLEREYLEYSLIIVSIRDQINLRIKRYNYGLRNKTRFN